MTDTRQPLKPRRPAVVQVEPPVYVSRVKLDGLPSMPLCERRHLPEVAAVYFVVYRQQVLYIGRSNNLRSRWFSGGVTHHALEYFESVPDVAIFWLEVPEQWQKSIEKRLMWEYLPLYNSVGLPSRWERTPLIANLDERGDFIPPHPEGVKRVRVFFFAEGEMMQKLLKYSYTHRVSVSESAQRLLESA